MTSSGPLSPDETDPEASGMSLVKFLERKFIPDHVELKSAAGRLHYQAILKHIVRPETVDRIFAPYVGISRARLRAVPDWPYLDNVRLCDLNVEHVRQLTSSASLRGYSPQTVKHIRNVISAIISHARRERLFSHDNPIAGVELPPMTRRSRHKLTLHEAKSIISQMQYPARETALIMISTGISVSEICALQWRNTNLTAVSIHTDGQLIPPRSISIRKKWSVDRIVDVSALRRREIALPEPLIEELIKLKHRNSTAPNSFVISTQDGTPIRPANLRMVRLKPIGMELDMPWLSWQVLRCAHEALLSELRDQLTRDLVAGAR